jgi:hypothetical protein
MFNNFTAALEESVLVSPSMPAELSGGNRDFRDMMLNCSVLLTSNNTWGTFDCRTEELYSAARMRCLLGSSGMAQDDEVSPAGPPTSAGNNTAALSAFSAEQEEEEEEAAAGVYMCLQLMHPGFLFGKLNS